MRLQSLTLMALLTVGIGSPASAQVVIKAAPDLVSRVTPDTVVARLMSFDRNADGKVVAGELPERMRSLLTRGDSGNDGALDSAEVRRLAMTSATIPGGNGLQGPRYGFADSFGFDTSKQIEGALDDLRLAGDTREKALDIARKFLAGADTRRLDNLRATMSQLLSREQLDDFQAATGPRTVTVPAIRRDGVTVFGATLEEAAGQERVMVPLRVVEPDLERYIEKYGLDTTRNRKAHAAILSFKARTPGPLSETERSALLAQLGGLLTDEQRDDLGAALARRPVVQLTGGVTVMPTPLALPGFERTVEPARIRMQNLLLTQ